MLLIKYSWNSDWAEGGQLPNPTPCAGISQKSLEGRESGDFVSHIIRFSSLSLLSLGSSSYTLIVKARTQQKTERWKKLRKKRKSQTQIGKELRNGRQPLFCCSITTFISVCRLVLLPHFPHNLMAKPTIHLKRAFGYLDIWKNIWNRSLYSQVITTCPLNTGMVCDTELLGDMECRNTQGLIPVLHSQIHELWRFTAVEHHTNHFTLATYLLQGIQNTPLSHVKISVDKLFLLHCRATKSVPELPFLKQN